jgi:hypothetical protein
VQPQEAVRKDAALEEGVELVLDEPGSCSNQRRLLCPTSIGFRM